VVFLSWWWEHLAAEERTRLIDWWQARFGLANRNVVIEADKAVSDLPNLEQGTFVSDQARRCSVAVVNTTPVTGLANTLTSYLEKLGLVVVRVADNQTNSQVSHLVVAEKNEACLEVAKVLDFLSPNTLEIVENPEAATTYRAALVLFVGQNMAELY
jgi:hypothetical protein